MRLKWLPMAKLAPILKPMVLDSLLNKASCCATNLAVLKKSSNAITLVNFFLKIN